MDWSSDTASNVSRPAACSRTLASIHRRLVLARPVDLEFSLYCAAVDVASEAFAATFLCDPFPPAFFAAFAGALFTTVFLPAVFLVAVCATFAASARFSANRFLVAAMILFIPSSLIRRFAFAGSGVAGAGGADSPRILAHRFCWASFMRRRAVAESFLRWLVGGPGVVAAVGLVPPDIMARSSAI